MAKKVKKPVRPGSVKFTAEKRTKAIGLMKAGNEIPAIAKVLKLHPQTLYRAFHGGARVVRGDAPYAKRKKAKKVAAPVRAPAKKPAAKKRAAW